MSEYQYYEFLALDKPLTEKQRAELRELSTRAEITATRFVNEYHWGDFRGNPRQMMERYFDAFLYLANWGTRHLMFRLPRGVLDAETAEQYCYTDAASLTETDHHLIISLYADRDPDDYWDETTGELGAMVQARSELAAGDLRLLYLAWLTAIQWDDVDDEDTEPPVPAGLGNLSAALAAIADFLEIDADLIAVAAEASPDITEEEDGGLAEWITSLPAKEKDKLLAMVAAGEGTQVQALLRRRFHSAAGRSTPSPSTRTAAELWKSAGTRKAKREKAEEQRRREEQAREAAAKAAAYEKRLDELASQTETAWRRAAELIKTRTPREYDQATALLRDLYALAERQGDPAEFTKRFLEVRAQHARKPSLQERFDKAGLPRELPRLPTPPAYAPWQGGIKPANEEQQTNAIIGNMVRVVNALHDPSSQMLRALKTALSDGKLCVVDISQLRGQRGLHLASIILAEVFSHNQHEFTKAKPRTVPCIAVVEEAQTVLAPSATSVAWVRFSPGWHRPPRRKRSWATASNGRAPSSGRRCSRSWDPKVPAGGLRQTSSRTIRGFADLDIPHQYRGRSGARDSPRGAAVADGHARPSAAVRRLPRR